MNTQPTALRLAEILEATEQMHPNADLSSKEVASELRILHAVNQKLLAHQAIKALAQPEQEPVCPDCKAKVLYECVACSSNNYPPKHQWVGLTDKEAMQICVDCGCLSEDWLVLLDAVEAKLKDKNT